MTTNILTALCSLAHEDVIEDLALRLEWPELVHLRGQLIVAGDTIRVEDTPSFKAYHQDILSNVAGFLPWMDLMNLRHCPEPAKTTADDECTTRIFEELEPFFPRNTMIKFFGALQSGRGAVVGPVVRRVLQRNGTSETATSTLTIVTASDFGGAVWSFFEEMGYSVEVGTEENAWTGNAIHLEHLSRHGEIPRVTLLTSRSGIGSVLLGFPTTANMVAITATSVISLYPWLSVKGECLVVDGQNIDRLQREETDQLDTQTHTNNAHWTKSCGVYCPERIRKIVDDKGISDYAWSPNRARSISSDSLSSSPRGKKTGVLGNLVWTIGRCRNPHCPVAALHDARKEILSSMGV